MKRKYVMGTRGFLGFVIDGVEKIAYNHWDSYPEGLGETVRAWLTQANLVEVQTLARSLKVVPPSSEPTDEDIEQLARYLDAGVGEQRERPDWYQLLRRTQGDPAAVLDAGVIEDASSFPCDSLFAEWGYLVDLDLGTFEAYRGFQQTEHLCGRFATRSSGGASNGYYPVALVGVWGLAELPERDEFLAKVNPPEDDE